MEATPPAAEPLTLAGRPPVVLLPQERRSLFQPITPQTGPRNQPRRARETVKCGLISLCKENEVEHGYVTGGEDVRVALWDLYTIYF